jgi:hypothetical protein
MALVSALKVCYRFLAAVRRAVADEHEDALGSAVALDVHELFDEFVERDDSVLVVAVVKQLRAAGLPRREWQARRGGCTGARRAPRA